MGAAAAAKSLSRVRLCAAPWTAAQQAALSMGFSRQEHWSGCRPRNYKTVDPHPIPSFLSLSQLFSFYIHLFSYLLYFLIPVSPLSPHSHIYFKNVITYSKLHVKLHISHGCFSPFSHYLLTSYLTVEDEGLTYLSFPFPMF